MNPLIPLFARLALPEWLRAPLAYVTSAIALIGFLWLLKGCYDDSVVKRHEAEVQAQVQATASVAAEDAAGAVNDTRNTVQKGNDDARKAANAGRDPLGDGLRSLRADTSSDRPATR